MQDTLDWYMEHFKEECERCKNILSVHAFRKPSKKRRKIVYCNCGNKECPKYQKEIAFIEKGGRW